jgi:mono/diheme cytochrome c family protein
MSQYEDNVTFENFKSGTNSLNPDGSNLRMPVKGTVARNQLSYYFPYKNTPEDYDRVAGFQNPVGNNPQYIAEGKRLFETYCWQCHGSEASPKGSLVEGGVYPPPTWDFEKKGLLNTLPEGRMFFSITYGRNLMGPHGAIVQPDQRWKIIHYLKSVAGTGSNAPAPSGSDTTKTTANNTATPTH